MSKLLDTFTQARRAQGGGGMGFLGKNRTDTKPRAAALVVEFATADAAGAEVALKAGADALLFTWDGKDSAWLETLKSCIDAAKTINEKAVCGLHITGGWDKLDRESIEQLKEQGINFVVLPMNAPARLLALQTKDVDLVVTVPMREGEMYPIFIRNLTTFDAISAVQLDFGLSSNISDMTIEEILQYRAVREAVRFPALLNVKANMSEADAYTLTTLGVQAVVLAASSSDEKTKEQIKALNELLTKVHQEDKDKVTVLK
ncbi:MAG: hypothetical protein ACJ788_23940 [Ktedonobacteraceae bacterium]